MAQILVVDDESSIRRTLKDILEFEKYSVDLAANGMDALEKAKETNYDAILLDIKMPEMDGMEVLEKLMLFREVPVIMISGHGTIETAVEAIKKALMILLSSPPISTVY